MWLFELILFALLGALLIVIGALLWARRMIRLIHEYHCQNVRPEDVGAYTKRVGIALILLGVFVAATGIINFASGTHWGWISFVVGFLAFLVLMHFTQKRYNGSWFG